MNRQSNLENVLNFCNQFLMLKVLASQHTQQSNVNKINSQKQVVTKKKTGRGQRFQNHTKKPSNHVITDQKVIQQIPQKPKTKKKKFQGGSTKIYQQTNHLQPKLQQNQQEKHQGYIPIENLLSQLSSVPLNKRNNQNNFTSFGGTSEKTSSFNNNFNNFNYQVKKDNYSSFKDYYLPTKQIKTKIEDDWMYNNKKQSNNLYEAFTLNPSRSEYLFQSPIKRNQGYSALRVPASRSRSKSPLDHSQSCSNLSSYSQNRSFTNQPVATSKKKKGQRQFHIPICSISKNQNQQQIPNMEVSRVTSTNHIIAKMQKQLMQQNNSSIRNQQYQQKSKYQSTRYDTKNKGTIIKQMEQYSMIQLDNGVRESLSFVSEAIGPPNPINIQLRK